MRKIIINAFVVFLFALDVNGQTVGDVLADYFSSFKENKLSTSSLSQLDKIGIDNKSFTVYKKYLDDQDESIRTEAYRLVGSFILSIKKDEDKNLVLSNMIYGLSDSSSSVRRVALGVLSENKPTVFSKEHFNDVSIGLRKSIDKSCLYRFIGYAGDSSFLDTLDKEEHLKLTSEEQWNLLLARCRLGDSVSVGKLVRILDKKKEDCRSFILMLPDFSYTKSRQIIDRLIDLAEKNEKKCPSENPASQMLFPYGYYILPYLSYSIAGFPVEVDDGELVGDFWEEWESFASWTKTHKEKYRINIYSYK